MKIRIGESLAAADEQSKRQLLQEKVVWLLGSGFSKPLGGPLFSDLMSRSTLNWVTAWVDEFGGAHDSLAGLSWIQALFDTGVANKNWANAEEFLEVVDECDREPVVQKFLWRLNNDAGNGDYPWPRVRALATEFVACATSYFVSRGRDEQDDGSTEAWHPYLAWGKILTDDDHVLTFNYDRVVETACRGRTDRLCKLHGSVPARDDLFRALRDRASIDGIQIPGRGKMRASTGELKEGWDVAAKKLEVADRLVIIGYSFPQSDPYARSFILRHAAKVKRVALVLGTYDDARRVREMFQRVLPHAVVNDPGLLAQEYLAEGCINPLFAGGTFQRFRHS